LNLRNNTLLQSVSFTRKRTQERGLQGVQQSHWSLWVLCYTSVQHPEQTENVMLQESGKVETERVMEMLKNFSKLVN